MTICLPPTKRLWHMSYFFYLRTCFETRGNRFSWTFSRDIKVVYPLVDLEDDSLYCSVSWKNNLWRTQEVPWPLAGWIRKNTRYFRFFPPKKNRVPDTFHMSHHGWLIGIHRNNPNITGYSELSFPTTPRKTNRLGPVLSSLHLHLRWICEYRRASRSSASTVSWFYSSEIWRKTSQRIILLMLQKSGRQPPGMYTNLANIGISNISTG